MPRLFLVEQDPSLREWCRLHLGTAGISVTPFDDAQRALEALRGEPPDLFLIDTETAGLGAFALAAAIRSNVRSAHVPLIFLVPGNDPEQLAQSLAIEPGGALTKPLSRELLLETVRARLGVSSDDSDSDRHARAAKAPVAAPARGTASGALLETKRATVLAVVVRNFVSLARAMPAASLDRMLVEFGTFAREAVFESGGWIVRGDATQFTALFEETPGESRRHAGRAIDAALGIVRGARAAKRWADANLPTARAMDISIGCGIHTGEVIVARLTVGGHLVPGIAGLSAELAPRLEGRAKSLHWSIACAEATAVEAGSRFAIGQRSSLRDTDHGVVIPIVEIGGYAPGAARASDLARIGEVREALVANTLLSRLAGDVDSATADRTLVVRPGRGPVAERPAVPGREMVRQLRRGERVETWLARRPELGREEVIKWVPLASGPPAFLSGFLAEYGKLAEVLHRHVAALYEVGSTDAGGFVSLESVEGPTLGEAIRGGMAVGRGLNALAQAAMAVHSLHQAGIVHGGLSLENFRIRADESLVLTDFNVTRRVERQLASAELAPIPVRRDFIALGGLLHAMLSGERTVADHATEGRGGEALRDPSRLPVALLPVQPLLDGLLGIAPERPIDDAQEVMLGLFALRDSFPLDSPGGGAARPQAA
jgi:CheY-like chemotaxis protein